MEKEGKKSLLILILLALGMLMCGSLLSMPVYAQEAYDAPIELIGHRGYSSEYPENTMPAFAGAYNAGFSGNEIDIWESDNGDIMVFHDKDTGRMCQGRPDYIWHVNSKNRTNKRYRIPYDGRMIVIPTLQEVLQLAEKHPGMVLLHIKTCPGEYELSQAGVDKIVHLIKAYHMEDRAVVYASKAEDVERFVHCGVRVGRVCGNLKRETVNDVIRWLEESDGDTLVITKMEGIRQEDFGRDLVDDCHKRGIRIGTYWSYTVDDIQFLHSIGADFAMSNWNLLTQYQEGFRSSSPKVLEITSENNGFRIDWVFAFNQEGCRYEIMRAEAGRAFESVAIVPGGEHNTGAYIDREVSPEITYMYVVRAVLNGEESQSSLPISGMWLTGSKAKPWQDSDIKIVFKADE